MPSETPSSVDVPASGSTGPWTVVQALLAFAMTFVVAATAARAAASSLGGGMSMWGFLAALAAGAALVLILLREQRPTPVMEAVFLLAVFTGIGSALLALFGPAAAVLGTAAAVFLHYGSRSVLTLNLVLAVGCAGVAANLGAAMRPTGAATILAVLATYDVAVMQAVSASAAEAAAALRRRAFFGMMLTERPAHLLLPVSAVVSGSGIAGVSILGAGDLVLPAVIVASVAATDARGAFLVGAGALLGVAAAYALPFLRTARGVLPVLPPVALGAIVGYVVSLLF